jgi:hypothetical protein
MPRRYYDRTTDTRDEFEFVDDEWAGEDEAWDVGEARHAREESAPSTAAIVTLLLALAVGLYVLVAVALSVYARFT